MKIVAKAIIFDRSNSILILRRSKTHPHFAHHLDFPGGEVERGESAIQAIRREVFEETGLIVPIALIKVVYQEQLVTERTLHVVSTVRLLEDRPNVKMSWEHDGSEWTSLHEIRTRSIPAGVDSYYLTVLKYLQALQ